MYKAKWHTKDVAVKKIDYYPQNSTEVKELSRANHENIVFLHGTAISNNTLYLVMELVDGGSLEALIYSENPKYEIAHVINWALQIAKVYINELIHLQIK